MNKPIDYFPKEGALYVNGTLVCEGDSSVFMRTQVEKHYREGATIKNGHILKTMDEVNDNIHRMDIEVLRASIESTRAVLRDAEAKLDTLVKGE